MKKLKHLIWSLLIPDDIDVIIRSHNAAKQSHQEFDSLRQELKDLQQEHKALQERFGNVNRYANNWQDVTRELITDTNLRWQITREVNKRQAENNPA